MSIGIKAGKGFISIFYRNMLEKLVGMAAMVILARKLSPYDFGLLSITEALLFIISIFGTTGLSEFLLAYKKDDVRNILQSAFWFNVVVSGILFGIFLLLVPLWAHAQSDTRIVNLGILIGCVFIFSQLQIIPKSILSRQLEFDKQVKIQAPFIMLVAAGKVVAAYLNFGVYSLIIPMLLFQPVITILLYRAARFSPGGRFFVNRWKEIYGFTKYLIGSGILSRVADQGDKIIIAKVLGLDKLGMFNIAMQMADLVTSQIVTITNNILSSVLPKYADDREKLYNHYISFLKVFAFLALPVLGIMLVAAKPLILLLYGPKWIEAVLPMQILVVYAAFRALTSSYGCVMNTLHLNKQSFNLTLAYAPFHLLASYLGSMLGIAGLAAAVVTVKLAFVNISIRQMMRALNRNFIRWYVDMRPFLVISTIITLALLFTSNLVEPYVPGYLFVKVMVISVAFIALYYCLFTVLFGKQLMQISSFLAITFPRSQIVFNYVFRL